MPRLRYRGIGEHRAERRQRLAREGRQVPRQLAAGQRAVGRHVSERQVPGATRRGGDREADERRPHRIETGGLGVERHEVRPPTLGDHRGQPGGVVHDLRRVLPTPRALQPRRRGRGGALRFTVLLPEPIQLRDQRAELELGEQLGEPRDVGSPHAQPLEIQLHRRVAPDGHQIAGEAGEIRVLQHRLARALPGDFSRARQDRVEVAIDPEEVERGLFPHATHPGDVVGAVADQREVVHHPCGRHAQPLAGVGRVHPLLLDRGGPAAAGIQERDTWLDELVEILVARHDDRLNPALRGALRQRSDHIVGLIAFDAQHRDAERLEDLPDPLDGAVEILLQLLAELLASRLILGVLLVAERLADVVHPAEVIGPVLFAEPQQEVGDAPGGGRVFAAPRRERPRDHGEEGPIDERVAVDEEETFGHGANNNKQQPRPEQARRGGTNGAGARQARMTLAAWSPLSPCFTSNSTT